MAFILIGFHSVASAIEPFRRYKSLIFAARLFAAFAFGCFLRVVACDPSIKRESVSRRVIGLFAELVRFQSLCAANTVLHVTNVSLFSTTIARLLMLASDVGIIALLCFS